MNETALLVVGVFSGHCETSRRFVDSSSDQCSSVAAPSLLHSPDIDIESERLRVLGGHRFAAWSLNRIANLRLYR